jgi:uncharacterized membrane protein
MDDSLLVTLLAVAALVLSIIAMAKISALQIAIDELKKRLGDAGASSEKSVAQPTRSTAVPPPLPGYVTQPKTAAALAPRPTVAPKPHFNWESILGVKLFAWIGGFAFFLGIVFFVKYAFENNWITPAMRIVAGAIVGAALIAVSLLPRIRRYRVPAQSLSATGILIFYADVYAAHSFYNLIPLTATIALMWIVTVGALALANYLAVQSVAWLALIGGFITPLLLSTGYTNPILFVIYIGVLDCAVAAVVRLKRWSYLLPVAALLSLLLLSAWTGGVFTDGFDPKAPHLLFLVIEGLFLGLCVAVTWQKELDIWTIIAMGIAGLGALIGISVARLLYENDLMLWLLLGNAGIIAFATVNRRFVAKESALVVMVGLALVGTSFVEWLWCYDILASWQHEHGMFAESGRAAMEARENLGLLVFRHVAIFLLYAAIPYLVGTKRLWPWMFAAIAAPIHFAFVHAYVASPAHLIPHEFFWLLPLAFALPAAVGVCYLLKKEHVDLASGDSRLASQGAAVLAFVSFIFPVQFDREWITLGWAIEGLLLILLFRWIPNRRLRAASLIVFTGAFVRLALNPAVFEYHPRTHTPIFNWYLYAYGIAAICLFLGARWFGEPKEKFYERKGSAFLYWMSGIVLFLLMNIEIADYFSIGPTLTFSFEGNFARDMTYTIAWSLFAFGLVVLGIVRNVRNVRLVGIGLLCLAFAKLFLHDLDSLAQLYRIVALIAVAIIAIVASFVYQRFLLPKAKS